MAKYPIILVHGIFRFDRLSSLIFDKDNSGRDNMHYFSNIRSTLMEEGYQAHHVNVNWGGSLDTRAKDLKRQIEEYTDNYRLAEKVNIIGHSMGGLDARWMICKHDMKDRVATLSTIGTPHHGSPFAGWVMENLSSAVEYLGKHEDISGIKDLTGESCAKMNQEIAECEEKNDVVYAAWAGVQDFLYIFTPLKFPYKIVEDEEGENDGLVSLKSARWNDRYYKGKIDADHLNLIGWWDLSEAFAWRGPGGLNDDIRKFYLKVAQGCQ